MKLISKYRLQLIAFLLLVLVIPVGYWAVSTRTELRKQAAVSGPTLSIAPATKTIAAGATATAGVTLDTGPDSVSAVKITLMYDPARVTIDSFQPGTILPVVLSPAAYAAGSVTVTLGAQPTTPFKGSDIVGTFAVHAVTTEPSTIAFNLDTSVASIGKSTNTLVSTKGMAINSGATPTPIAGSGTTLGFTPSTLSTSTGATNYAGIFLNTGTDTVSAAEIHITYDPAIVVIDGFQSHNILPIILSPAQFGNGSATVTLGAQPTAPFKGGDQLGAFSFHTLNTNPTTITYSSDTSVASIGNPTNSLVSATGMDINSGGTINGVGSPTPTRTPTMRTTRTPTPTPTRRPSHTPTPTPTPRGSHLPTPTRTSTPTPTPTRTPTPTPPISTNTPIATPTPASTNTPTATPTPAPTPTPPPGSTTLTMLVKFAGVTDNAATGTTVKVKFYLRDGTIVGLNTPLAVTYVGSGVYKTTATITNPFPDGSAFTMQIKGAKHVAVQFCKQTGQTTPCAINDSMSPTTYSFDFTGIPLPAGDVNQDGTLDSTDIKAVANILGKLRSSQTAADLNLADVNYDGTVDGFDLSLILQSLAIRHDE